MRMVSRSLRCRTWALGLKFAGSEREALLSLPGAAPLRYAPDQPRSKSYVLVPETMLTKPGLIKPHWRRSGLASWSAYLVTAPWQKMQMLGVVAFGVDYPMFWIAVFHPRSLEQHTAFRASRRVQLESFHREGLSEGGTNNGDPGLRSDGYPADIFQRS
jgi:hypothetical protein